VAQGDAVGALAEQQAELASLLEPLTGDAWERPTRCAGWDVRDVVLHLAQTDGMALASLEGRFADDVAERLTGTAASPTTVDEGAAAMVAAERAQPAAVVHDRWRLGAAALLEAFRSADPHRRVRWVAGELSVGTLATTRLAETWIHAGDVASAVGVRLAPAARLRHVARLAWRTLPYAFGRAGLAPAGPVAFELRGPTGEAWSFRPDAGEGAAIGPVTVVEGDGVELCLVAARRLDPAATSLGGRGPDLARVLSLGRTYA
jgi:uncharacterized protein (TIGR03084 family)